MLMQRYWHYVFLTKKALKTAPTKTLKKHEQKFVLFLCTYLLFLRFGI